MKAIGLLNSLPKVLVFAIIILFISGIPVSFAEEKIPSMGDTKMLVPWNDFKEILDKLEKAGQRETVAPPPVDAVVSSADYFANVNKESVDLKITARIVVLKENGWVSVPVIQANTPLVSGYLDGKPVILSKMKDNYLHLVTKGAGVHTLELVMKIGISKNSGPEKFSFPSFSHHH